MIYEIRTTCTGSRDGRPRRPDRRRSKVICFPFRVSWNPGRIIRVICDPNKRWRFAYHNSSFFACFFCARDLAPSTLLPVEFFARCLWLAAGTCNNFLEMASEWPRMVEQIAEMLRSSPDAVHLWNSISTSVQTSVSPRRDPVHVVLSDAEMYLAFFSGHLMERGYNSFFLLFSSTARSAGDASSSDRLICVLSSKPFSCSFRGTCKRGGVILFLSFFLQQRGATKMLPVRSD